jgi:hypothetical protein
MAKIQPTPPKARQAFRDKLPARAQGAFDRLARLIDRPWADLRAGTTSSAPAPCG